VVSVDFRHAAATGDPHPAVFQPCRGLEPGDSFGMFNSGSAYTGWVLSALAVAIIIFLLNWLRKSNRGHISLAIGLIIGGAVGNIVDRAVHGAVFDFLDVFIGRYHWPAFNVADSGITIGAVILVLDSVLSKSENGESKDSPERS